MSWDVSIINFSRDYNSIEEIPDDEQPLNLGSRVEVHKAVSEFFPGTNWCDASWGVFDCQFGSVEFNLGKDDPSDSLMLHVRASNEIVPLIVAMCKKQNWSGLDCSNGEILEKSQNPSSGIEGWRDLLEQVSK